MGLLWKEIIRSLWEQIFTFKNRYLFRMGFVIIGKLCSVILAFPEDILFYFWRAGEHTGRLKKCLQCKLAVNVPVIYIHLNFFHSLANSADNTLMIFSYFFPENRIWHFMQIVTIGDNLHEMSNPVFWEIKKIFQNVICWKFYPVKNVNVSDVPPHDLFDHMVIVRLIHLRWVDIYFNPLDLSFSNSRVAG